MTLPLPTPSSERVPPHNVEAEQAILGGILLDPDALGTIIEIIEAQDFYHEAHQLIYQQILTLFEHGDPIDIITLTESLQSRHLMERCGGITYITGLTDLVVTSANITHYAKIVKEKATLRRLIQITSDIFSRCFDLDTDVDSFLDEVEKQIFDISENKVHPDYYPIREVVKESFEQIEKLTQTRKFVTGVPTGFDDLDRLTAGFQPSDLIIVAGRPGMGKTALALNIAQHCAGKHGIGVGIFSLEMSKTQLVLRMLCSEAQVDSQRLRRGYIDLPEMQRLIQAAGKLAETPILIDESATTVLEIRATSRRMMAESGIGLIIVDYLQLMRGRANAERREQEISEISRSLKILAKELNVPIIAISQLNRRVEDRKDRRPELADLRESGAIEQDADLILFIYRDEVYNRDEANPNRGVAEVIIGKQRNGPTGIVKLAFQNQFTTFRNLTINRDESMVQ